MSVGPIDTTITLQRTTELSRNHEGDSTHTEVSQHQIADKIGREIQQQEQQVIQSSKAEEGKVDRDGRGNSGGESGKKKKKRRESGSKAASKRSDSLFDVSI